MSTRCDLRIFHTVLYLLVFLFIVTTWIFLLSRISYTFSSTPSLSLTHTFPLL
ncbi:uncharacterized protein LACBIDRAFT_307591 [Laccaria bicolor S238N-H82]|uniref:Predicted protein n=1 Tax=Laccaria bicolor (strain S238N-H82 / ATCC MYA-4686) TaxID=486041 RepID=B0DQI2_LACBS|nr:uncharacterized protein LACBIDRAFT_307591 [Laccaria bicolor S238N-H82]EDR03116.1 predicted protein [Laccaria bicolor S238N-H82]|eukprot:XP_001886257.1 predicted protein [Laccaria bicolor S238N-H82]